MILLDTNIIIGYFSPEDTLHQKCRDLLSGKNVNDYCIIPEVFWEAVSIVSVRHSSEDAIKLGNILEKNFSFYDTKNIPLDSIWELFQELSPHRFSYVDTLLLVLLEDQEIDVLTLDEKLKKRITSRSAKK
jgi:predicted nucleic acid-binding protein